MNMIVVFERGKVVMSYLSKVQMSYQGICSACWCGFPAYGDRHDAHRDDHNEHAGA